MDSRVAPSMEAVLADHERKSEMGHHIDENGRFQSDKYPDLAPDKIVLSFKDPAARRALRLFVHATLDAELGRDILTRIDALDAASKAFRSGGLT